MFVIVCYDIPDDRQRNKVSEILENYGERVQFSVFECDISKEHLKKLKKKIGDILKEEDSVRYYHLCEECVSKVEVIHGPEVTRVQSYFMV